MCAFSVLFIVRAAKCACGKEIAHNRHSAIENRGTGLSFLREPNKRDFAEKEVSENRRSGSLATVSGFFLFRRRKK